MFGIGMQELVIILLVALVVLGPTKLPGVARSIGKGMRELRRASDDLRSTIMFDDDEPPRGRSTPPPPAVDLAPPAQTVAEKIAEGSPQITGSLATASAATAATAEADDGVVARGSEPAPASPTATADPPAVDEVASWASDDVRSSTKLGGDEPKSGSSTPPPPAAVHGSPVQTATVADPASKTATADPPPAADEVAS